MEKNYDFLLSILPTGEQNATPTDSLVGILGLSGSRALRKLISSARASGLVICSSDNGYFLPSTRAEIERFYRTTKKKALSTLTILKSARIALNEVDGQQKLNEVI